MSSSPLSGTGLEALFYDFLIGSVVNPVNSCVTSEHSFLQWGVIVSGLVAFLGFSLTAMASSIVYSFFQIYILFTEDSLVALIILSIEYHV